eukprot:460065-Pleurochrysis_carterae.AAC.1
MKGDRQPAPSLNPAAAAAVVGTGGVCVRGVGVTTVMIGVVVVSLVQSGDRKGGAADRFVVILVTTTVSVPAAMTKATCLLTKTLLARNKVVWFSYCW